MRRNWKYDALKNAITSNSLSELKNLTENGVDINTTEEYSDQNILIYYILNHDELDFAPFELIEFLIKCGISVNHRGNKRTKQMSALHYAVLSKSMVITTCLIENGADVELQDKNGNTALWQGIMNYRGDDKIKAILEYLLLNGASLDTKNYHGNSPRKMIETISGGIKAGHNDQKWELNDLLKNN